MSIGDRQLKYEHRWASKLTGKGGSSTNVKGKRRGIFGHEKGKKRSKSEYFASGKTTKGGGKARNHDRTL
eukprot:11091433-Karenia_brevis.AAC.1